MQRHMRLGIFGGTFDPIHYGHLLLAEFCREACRLDRVWFVPAATPPHKSPREITPAGQRLEMLELAVGGNEFFAVSRMEVDRGGVSYTVDTLAELKAADPQRELFFLLGGDSLKDLPQWREPRGSASWRCPSWCVALAPRNRISRAFPGWFPHSGSMKSATASADAADRLEQQRDPASDGRRTEHSLSDPSGGRKIHRDGGSVS